MMTKLVSKENGKWIANTTTHNACIRQPLPRVRHYKKWSLSVEFALNGDYEKTEENLLRGVDPNIKDPFGYTPLHYSARNGHLTVCKLLLSKGADPNARTKAGGATPLQRAAFCGHLEIVRCLLKSGADPLIVDDDCKTSLHKAAENKHLKIFELLINDKNGSILKEMKDKRDKTAEDYL